MNTAVWTALVLSIVSFLNAVTASLQARKANQKLNNHLNDVNKP